MSLDDNDGSHSCNDHSCNNYSAWNPGLSSQIPASLLSSVTLFRPENSTVDYRSAKELSDFCGLPPAELVAFRLERLIIHDLLVRVSSDLSVPDGPNYEDLGISLRSMVHTIYSDYILPEIDNHQQTFNKARSDCKQYIVEELNKGMSAATSPATVPQKPSFFSRFRSTLKKDKKEVVDQTVQELRALEYWRQQSVDESDSMKRSCLQSIHKVASAIIGHRGGMVNPPDLVVTIAANIALSGYGSEVAHLIVDKVFNEALEAEGFRRLPVQSHPVVMNVKGASASGKSTIRPQQRELAGCLDIPWEDFALISPDYWRKHLLDYESLGEDHKYAAMLTGQELEIVDKKLDVYMAGKAARGELTHLLIDRFRFDSFNVDKGGHSRDSKLLSRFGDRIFLFFMITPPAETVVRAWERGKTTGRYKAVDDLLFHNIEAYTGMPDLFLSWVLSADKRVHFEFLDNSVEKGQLPKTAAFGWNNTMTILDVDQMRAIEQFRKVNVDAKSADSVFVKAEDSSNGGFLERCLNTIPEVKFLDGTSGEVYAVVKESKLVWWNRQLVEKRSDAEFLKSLFSDLGSSFESIPQGAEMLVDALNEKQFTLGDW